MAEKKEYTASQKVKTAEAAMQKNTRPEYRSGWESQMRDVMDRILNREDFHYNLNGDALYRQYRERAQRDGKIAMADAMGQAAALTGGYGNSYAQSVGQQAYQRQMERLGDRIPELYALALDQYRQQSEDLQRKYDLLSGAEGRDYARYQDSLAAWQQEADQLWRSYTDARDFDYGVYRDDVADWQKQRDFDESKRRYDQEWNAAHPAMPASPALVRLYSVVPSAAKKTTTTIQAPKEEKAEPAEEKKPKGVLL